MRFVWGPLPPSETFQPARAGWTPLSRVQSDTFVVVASAVAVAPLAAGLLVLFGDDGATVLRFKADLVAFTIFVAALLLLVPAHEFIHTLAYRAPLRSRRLITGVWLRRVMWYVVYDSPLARDRVLVMLVAPFVVLSAVGGVAVLLAPDEWRAAAGFVLLVHTSLCAGDAVVVGRLLTRVPRDALIHNDGWTTYWGRAHDPANA